MIAWLIATPWARYLAYGALALLFLGYVALRLFNAGKAAEQAQAAIDVLANGLRAKSAAAKADLTPEGEKNDQNNRDRR